MRRKNLTQRELWLLTGISERQIRNLMTGAWKRVSKSTIGRLCAALDATPDELFEVLPADIWFPIRRDHKVTVHLGSTSLESRGGAVDGNDIDRLGIGTWDVRSLAHVTDYLNRTLGGVVFEYVEHTQDLYEPSRVDAVFAKGNHLIIGSPIVNPIAEDAVCRAFGVPSRQSCDAGVFPYRFLWDRARDSAFGTTNGHGPGIIAAGEFEPIARRTVICGGENGEDCGLVFTYRHDPAGRSGGETTDGDAIIIAVMGHSGCATLAGTQLLCTEAGAQAVYPAQASQGVLRAFRVGYRRPDASSGRFDNREIVSHDLIPAA